MDNFRKYIILFVLAVFWLFLSCEVYGENNLSVHFIDVGYGDCILVKTPAQKVILIDAGDSEHSEKVIEYLNRENINKINLVIITHPHPDHIGGFFPLIDNLTIERVATTKYIVEVGELASFWTVLDNKDIPYLIIERGDEIKDFYPIEMEVLNPNQEIQDFNETSLVIKLTYQDTSFLFTGDIGVRTAEELAYYYQDKLQSNILKVPHHGKGYSIDFIQKVQPRAAIISVGPSPWGGPDEETVKIYQKLEIPLYRTDKNGTIIVKSDGQKLWILLKNAAGR